MAALSGSHLIADSSQGAVPALLPFLIARRGYSYAEASALVLAATGASSVIQPLFGTWADRRSMAWLMPSGILLGGAGIALTGVAPTYLLTFLAVVASGLGVAAFHPEGSRYANYVSGDRRASGMSIFSVGGNIGFAVGPLLITPLVLLFGLPGTLAFVLPALAMAMVLSAELPRLATFRPGGARAARAPSAQPDRWGPFTRLGVMIAFRTFVYFGLVTFVPLYFVNDLGVSKAGAEGALIVMLVGGAFGTLVGGPLADRISRRAVLIGSMAVLPPLVLLFVSVGPVAALPVLFVIGAATIATFSVTVVIGQEYLPNRVGLASGVTLGLSIGLGGLGAPLLGLVADRWSLEVVFDVVAVLPLLALAAALTLPRERPRTAGAVEARGEATAGVEVA